MKLARYNDSLGRSSGYWLVKAVPGLIVHRLAYGAWRLHPLSDPLVPGSADFQKAEATWGRSPSARPAMLLLQANPQLKQWFTSRDAALLELESALSSKESELSRTLKI